MKAMAVERFDDAEKIEKREFPVPQCGENEVLIRVAYAGVNPVDWKICEGMMQKLLDHEFPIIPGWEAAGTVEEVGHQVSDFSKGDPVFTYCRKPKVHQGTYAEYVAVEAAHVAPKPTNLSFAEAAGIPLCALTAWQAFFDDANLQSGDTVLIHAGAGGVGSMAIQLAKHRGATVITTASAKNHSYVKELGADHAIDYTAEDFVAKVKEIAPDGVDMVLDCVGNETLERSFEVIRKGGTIRSIVNKPNPEKAKEREVSSGFTFVRPDGDELRKIASLLEAEEIVAPKVNELPLEQAVEAFAKSKTEHTVGKLVLKVSTS